MKSETTVKKALTSPEKYHRASVKRNLQNRILKSKTHTAIKKVLKAISSKATKEETNELLKQAQSQIDKNVTKKVIKKNKSSRMKSTIAQKVKEYVLAT